MNKSVIHCQMYALKSLRSVRAAHKSSTVGLWGKGARQSPITNEPQTLLPWRRSSSTQPILTRMFLTGTLLLCTAFWVADAQADSLARCWSAKLSASSGFAKRALACERAAARSNGSIEALAMCRATAAQRLSDRWARLDTGSSKRGLSCERGISSTDAHAWLDDILSRLVDASESEAAAVPHDDRNVRNLLKHSERFVDRLLRAHARHIRRPNYIRHQRSVERARTVFMKHWEHRLSRMNVLSSLDLPELAEETMAFAQMYADEIAITASEDRLGECPLHGVAFSPYADGQDPNERTFISHAQIYQRLTDLRRFTPAIRTYGADDGLEAVSDLAGRLGMETHIGAWLDRDNITNRVQIDNLIRACKVGEVDTAIVGSEVLLRGDMTVSALTEYIDEVRTACPDDVKVTTAAVTDTWLTRPELVTAVDEIYLHVHPYWERAHINDALRRLVDAYDRVQNVAGGKLVVIAETGWPTAGERFGDALPSRRNAATFLRQAVTWAENEDVPLFYFSSHDERWKAAHEGVIGRHWGLLSTRGRMKPHARSILRRCRRASAAELARALGTGRIPDESTPGDPTFILDFVPPAGSFENLHGRANFLVPKDHAIVTYIRVAGRWWTKPTSARPASALDSDGRFEVDITTGGTDQNADRVMVCLTPSGFAPPIALGLRSVPQSVSLNADQCEVIVR